MRLNVEEEQSIAFAIRDAEKAAWDAVAAVGSRPPNKGRTRAAQVRALEIAVEQLMLRSFKEPALKPAANAARRAWNEAETQHWNLAMSAERIARGEAKKLGGMLLSQEDLEQEGHIGLLRAARRFDPDLGIRFSTYARWWVRAQMTRAMETSGRTIRVPVARSSSSAICAMPRSASSARRSTTRSRIWRLRSGSSRSGPVSS
jgi:RNA polymerase sigma factor (sigma-70 family)